MLRLAFVSLSTVSVALADRAVPRMTLHGLPDIVYAGEERLLTVAVHAAHEMPRPGAFEDLSIQASFLPHPVRVTEPVVSGTSREAGQGQAMLPLTVPGSIDLPHAFEIRLVSASAGELGSIRFRIRPLDDAASARLEGDRFVDTDGEWTVFGLQSADWASRRKWAPLKALARGTARRLTPPREVSDHARTIRELPVQAARPGLPSHLDHTVITVPDEDLLRRVDTETVFRSLEAAVTLLRRGRPAAAVSFAIPRVFPGSALDAHYERVIRDVARHVQAAVILPDPLPPSAPLYAPSREPDEAAIPPQPVIDTALRLDLPGSAIHWQAVDLRHARSLLLELELPEAPPPEGLHVIVGLKDKDGRWFQYALPDPLTRADRHRHTIDISAAAPRIRGVGHAAGWCAFQRSRIREVGIGIASPGTYTASVPARLSIRDMPPDPAGPRFHINHPGPSTVPLYGSYELAFRLDGIDGLNPFDPDAIRVDAHITSPSGATLVQPAFFHQEYRRELRDGAETISPVGLAHWRLRFAPLETGPHTLRLIADAAGYTAVTSAPVAFQAMPPACEGFVRVSRTDPAQFETTTDAPFYPLGLNIHAPHDVRCAEMLGFPVPPDRGTFAYDTYFERLAEAGATTCVVWLAPWWLEFEWSADWPGFHGLGDFSLGNAWRLDYLLRQALAHGLRLHLVLENHGKLSLWIDEQWDTNPYNVLNGGPVDDPEAFFASSHARARYRNKLRYIVARWGASTALMSLELVGEINLTGNSRRFANHAVHADWTADMIRYLREIDLYDRPVAMHYSNDWRTIDPAVASLPALDFFVGDIYKPGGSIIPWVLDTQRHNGVYGKPTFSTEFGGYWNGTTPARLEADLHAGLWSNFMTEAAGAPHFWWFEFIDRHDRYHHLAAFAAYIQGEDKRGRFDLLELDLPHDGTRQVAALLTRRDRDHPAAAIARAGGAADIYGWVYDTFAMEVYPPRRHAIPIAATELTLDLPPGHHELQFWDTDQGGRIATQRIQGSPSTQLAIPPFKRDIALKIFLNVGEERSTITSHDYATRKGISPIVARNRAP